MQITFYPDIETVKKAMSSDEPLLVLFSHDGNRIITSCIDDSVEHYILLKNVGISELEIDKYFRILVDKDGADWTFVCPSNYKNIENKEYRIKQFYKDGFNIISKGLTELGYLVSINIPNRYRRHFDILSNLI